MSISDSKASKQRVISLLASGTEIVSALGLADRLVGLSHECDYPPEVVDSLPRLSSLKFKADKLTGSEITSRIQEYSQESESPYQIHIREIKQLDPDVIIAQEACQVCAVARPDVEELVEMHNLDVRVVSIDAHKLAEVGDCIQQVARALEQPQVGQNVAKLFEQKLELVRTWTGSLPQPSVLALEWFAPPMISSTFMPEQISAAGGLPLPARPDHSQQQVTWDKLEGLDPDALVLAPCGLDVESTYRAMLPHLDQFYRVAPRAFERDQVFVVDGSAYFNRTTPRLADGTLGLGHLLHPEKVPAPHPAIGRKLNVSTLL